MVSPIRKLSPEVSVKIAAGEVVDRPVSVVKELVENSLDAGSSRITIELADGGKSLVRVEDNGCGIPAAELPLATESFSTSKIREIDDIYSIRTLGFRGEALASIRAVSRMSIGSRSRDEEPGREMTWEGDSFIKDAPVVRNPGTRITVRDLFFNLPARRKFLSSPASEQRRVMSLVQSYALAYPEVAITVRDGGRELLTLSPSKPEERLENILGGDVYPHMRPVELSSSGLNLKGFASLPQETRGNRSFQFFFINRRNIKDRLLYHAVSQAYESLVPGGRFPYVVLFLDIPQREIDVNVHPAKAEIRFRNEREIHRLVVAAVREAVGGSRDTFKEKVEAAYRSIFPGAAESAQHSGAAQDELFRHTDAAQAMPAERAGWGGAIVSESPVSLFEQEGAKEQHANLYWQLHQSFIMIQIRGGMVVVDQHAAHERILYDDAKRSLEGAKPVVQSLLFPATLELSPEEFEKFEKLSDVLPAMGFEVEAFGARSVIVRGIPAGARNWDEGRLLQEMLGEMQPGKTSKEELLKSYACRSAVKANTRLSVREMESLTDQLFATEFPFTCPHGRPTMLRVDTADLERRFQRSVSPEK
jgi:DNA mismatch repair protein MutL